MHKTAFKIGGLTIQTYGAGPGTRILEIGAYDVNGSLRQHVGPDMDYVGIDIEAGPGVDIVVELGKPLPFDAESFDLILASSVFEHDPAFWSTFLELTRVVRKGGYIYVNAPSNGGSHRYPEDHWRFYPDSGLALARWAASQGWPVELIESFICEQDEDNWNDFSAIFRRLPANTPKPESFVYLQVPSYNVHSWQTTDLIRLQGETQDMLLFSAAQNEIRQHQQAYDVARQQTDELTAKLIESEALVSEQARFHTKAQRQIERLEEEIAAQTDELQYNRQQLAGLSTELEDLRGVNRDQDIEIDRLRNRERELTSFGKEQERLYLHSNDTLRQAEATLTARVEEVQALTRQLADSEERAAEKDWLRYVFMILAAQPFWWSLLPSSWRHARELKLLLANGLFDADGYLAHYPDVAKSGMNPLRHFIWHGMTEGRRRHFH